MVGGVRFGALDRPDVQPDVPVYVRRVDEDGYDEVTCEPSEPVDERIARRAEEIASLDRFHPSIGSAPASYRSRTAHRG
jgi:hypothetical protein